MKTTTTTTIFHDLIKPKLASLTRPGCIHRRVCTGQDICFIAVRTLWLNLSARCLSWFTARFNRPTPSDSTPSSRLWCIPTQCAALPFLSGLSPLRFLLLHNPGVHAGASGFNPMLLPKLDRREIPRSRDRGNSYRSNPGSPSIRGSGSCLRLCRVVFACYTPTGGSRPTPAGTGQGGVHWRRKIWSR